MQVQLIFTVGASREVKGVSLEDFTRQWVEDKVKAIQLIDCPDLSLAGDGADFCDLDYIIAHDDEMGKEEEFAL